jgi:hypothetical protein
LFHLTMTRKESKYVGNNKISSWKYMHMYCLYDNVQKN